MIFKYYQNYANNIILNNPYKNSSIGKKLIIFPTIRYIEYITKVIGLKFEDSSLFMRNIGFCEIKSAITITPSSEIISVMNGI